jgi:NitT/TauT family transport system ATP-binding protein
MTETNARAPGTAPRIVTRNVTKVYDTVAGPMVAVDDFSLDVADGEFVCIVGPSGCGKSTYLRMLAGLDTHSSGTIQIRPGSDPKKPLNSVVFQEYAVFPWKTVIDNVAFGPQMRGVPRA